MSIDKKEISMIEHNADLEDPKPPILLAVDEQIPLPAELAHMSREDLDILDKKLVRKIDMRLMPIVILMFWLNILDRNSIANAKIAGLPEDLKISNSQYNTVLMM